MTLRGIPQVSFLVYDGKMNPIDQVTTDQSGYAYVEDLGITGKVYLRELEAEGYIVDTALKTVYVRPGETTEVTWKNTPITGQLQIWKKSADDNPINGFPAGTPLQGAVFGMWDIPTGTVAPQPGHLPMESSPVAAIDEALDEMRESGELEELSTRYFGQDITSQ